MEPGRNGPPATHENMAHTPALVIGINGYANVSPLDLARADAEAVAQVLVGELGFPTTNVHTLLDGEATKRNIMERFLAF